MRWVLKPRKLSCSGMWRRVEFAVKLILQVAVVVSFTLLAVHNIVAPLGFSANQLLTLERCVNLSIFLIMGMEMPASIGMILYGWRLARFRSQLIKGPLKKPVDARSLEFAAGNCRWVQADRIEYAPFGKLSRKLRSPRSMLVIGILRTIAFVAQTPITLMSLLLHYSVSLNIAFLPLVCASFPTGIGSAVVLVGLNVYSDAIEKRRFISGANVSLSASSQPVTLVNKAYKPSTLTSAFDSCDTLNPEMHFTAKTP